MKKQRFILGEGYLDVFVPPGEECCDGRSTRICVKSSFGGEKTLKNTAKIDWHDTRYRLIVEEI